MPASDPLEVYSFLQKSSIVSAVYLRSMEMCYGPQQAK